MRRKIRKYFVPVLFMTCSMLTACGLGKTELSGGSYSNDTRHIAAVIEKEDIRKLDSLKNLKTADLSGSCCYEEIIEWEKAHPDVYVHYTAEFPDGTVADSHAESISVSISPENIDAAAAQLQYLPRLREVKLTGSDDKTVFDALQSFSGARPDVHFDCSFELGGRKVSTSGKKINMTGCTYGELKKLRKVLPAMYNLKTVDLGSDEESPKVDFEMIKSLQELRPDVKFLFDFMLYDREVSLGDKSLDLSYTTIRDEGELVRQVISCMPELEYLDMDSSGVSDEAMASIRDDFPDVKVVWRVWFGDNYTVRTDVERILASRPSVAGTILTSNAGALKYCTEVKYLDIGHNDLLDDISFISYMPKLEVAILAMGCWSDTSPIADCPELEYLEIQTTQLTDLRPLAGLKKLKHLNICYLYDLEDITPLYGLTQLERLWIGCIDPVPKEQIREMQRRAPQCEINTTTYDPTEGGWRYVTDTPDGLAPRYSLLRKQFGYDRGNMAFAFPWNDPKCRYFYKQ